MQPSRPLSLLMGLALASACGADGPPSALDAGAPPSAPDASTSLDATPAGDAGRTDAADAGDGGATRDRLFRVIQFNLTGHAVPGTVAPPANNGSLDILRYLEWEMHRFPNIDAASNPEVAAIPDAVLLEEVCYNQFEDLRSRYPNALFNPWMENHPYCNQTDDHRLGQVILSPWPILDPARTELGSTDTHFGRPDQYIVFGLLCGDVAVPSLRQPVKTCVAHLRAGNPVDEFKSQVDIIAATLNPVIEAGQPVVFGGDLNNKPEYRTLDPLYRLDRVGGWRGAGLFDEADQTDRRYFRDSAATCTPTACRSGQRTTARLVGGCIRDFYKFDYIFFSSYEPARGGFRDPSALSMGFVLRQGETCDDSLSSFQTGPYPSRSDHHLYRAQATLSQ